MGWDYIRNRSNISIEDYFLQEVYDKNTIDYEIIDNVVYLAENVGSDAKLEIICFVIFIDDKNQGGWIGHKIIDESCNPDEIKCPMRIINKLTFIDNQYSIKWRHNVIEYWNNSVDVQPNSILSGVTNTLTK